MGSVVGSGASSLGVRRDDDLPGIDPPHTHGLFWMAREVPVPIRL